MAKYKGLILFGPPCAGKGTVGRQAASSNPLLRYVASGDMVRDVLGRGGSLADELLPFLKRGRLVSDDLICRIFKAGLEDSVGKTYDREIEYLLIDGMYRTPAQPGLLEDVIDPMGVFCFNVPDDVLMERCVQRVLDAVESGLKPRDDDTPVAMAVRLKEYHEISESALDYFIDRDVPVHMINANDDRAVVFNRFFKIVVKNYLFPRIS